MKEIQGQFLWNLHPSCFSSFMSHCSGFRAAVLAVPCLRQPLMAPPHNPSLHSCPPGPSAMPRGGLLGPHMVPSSLRGYLRGVTGPAGCLASGALASPADLPAIHWPQCSAGQEELRLDSEEQPRPTRTNHSCNKSMGIF